MSSSAVPLSSPRYGARWGEAIVRFFRKYATFSGRASRSEYWWWVLTNVIVSSVLSLFARADGESWGGVSLWPMPYVVWGAPFGQNTIVTSVAGAIALVYSLGTLLPSLAVIWRRLHDTDRSGAWFFLILIPVIGAIVLIVFTAERQRPSGARYDADGAWTSRPPAQP
jgi:uncharacterized membrane protein YhaH (DUF805 family)